MESQMLSLHSSHVLSVLVHCLDQLYRTPLGEIPRYKVYDCIPSFDTCTCTVCVYVEFCSFYCLACLLHFIIDTDHCVVVGRAIV